MRVLAATLAPISNDHSLGSFPPHQGYFRFTRILPFIFSFSVHPGGRRPIDVLRLLPSFRKWTIYTSWDYVRLFELSQCRPRHDILSLWRRDKNCSARQRKHFIGIIIICIYHYFTMLPRRYLLYNSRRAKRQCISYNNSNNLTSVVAAHIQTEWRGN